MGQKHLKKSLIFMHGHFKQAFTLLFCTIFRSLNVIECVFKFHEDKGKNVTSTHFRER